jgi:HEAT repeat protein
LTFEDKISAAYDSRTSVTLFKTLAKDKDWRVRKAVIKSPYAPQEVLQQLCHDSSWIVRKAAKYNLYIQDDIFHRYS